MAQAYTSSPVMGHTPAAYSKEFEQLMYNRKSIIPYAVAVDHDRVLLTDYYESRVIIFFNENIADVCTSRPYPCGIAVNSKGDAYITYD